MKRFLLVLVGFWISLSAIQAQNPGDLDLSFNADGVGFGEGANQGVVTSALQSDGKILIGGFFTTVNGSQRNRIARLNADGSIDQSFDPGTSANSDIWSVAIQSDGKICNYSGCISG